MDLQPFLKGILIELRPLRESDFEDLYFVASDPLVWEQHPRSDRYQRPVFELFFKEAIASGGALLASDAKTGIAIGSSRYYDFDSAQNSVAIGFTFLSRKCWGNTFNKEMKQLMLSHAFESVDTVRFHIGENNIRSQRAIEKIGAELEGRIEVGGDSKLVYRILK